MAITVLTVYCIFLVLAVIWATTTNSRAAAAPSPKPTRPAASGAVREHCPAWRQAVVRYRAITWQWQDKRKGRRADATPTARGSCASVLRAVVEWRERAAKARARFRAWWRQEYAWWLWLPANWRRLGACETGYGREPGNWTWDSGSYVSAFGIYRPAYQDDAARAGGPPWPSRRSDGSLTGRYPTPREQYDAGLSHYRAHGDGWGCPGP